MSVYVQAAVPVASRGIADAAVGPLLESPNADGVSTFSVPLSPAGGSPSAEPTHYGCNAAVGPETAAALPLLQAAIPGCVYATCLRSEYLCVVDWLGFLDAHDLQPQVV